MCHIRVVAYASLDQLGTTDAAALYYAMMVPSGDRSLFGAVWDKNAVDAEFAADVLLDQTETQANEALSKASKEGMKVQQLLSYSVAGVIKYAAYLLARNSSRSGWQRCLVISTSCYMQFRPHGTCMLYAHLAAIPSALPLGSHAQLSSVLCYCPVPPYKHWASRVTCCGIARWRTC